jgi:hypothetical protein
MEQQMIFEGQKRTYILLAASVALTACFVGAVGPASAMVRQAPVAASTAVTLVQDAQRPQAEQMQQQQRLQREEMAKAMRRAAIRREEAKVIGAIKKYLRPEYEQYRAGQGTSPDTGMGEGRNR